MPTTPKTTMEERFDFIFTVTDTWSREPMIDKQNPEKIKAFIKAEQRALLEEIGEKITGLKAEFWDDQDHAVGGYISKKDIKSLLSAKKKEYE